MSTPAVYSFKGNAELGQAELHMVYHSDGYPRGAADLLPDLTSLATRIWDGNEVDLENTGLPRIDGIELRVSLEASQALRCTPFRYEIEVVDGRPVAVKVFQHSPVIPDELLKRLESAQQTLADVQDEMQKALNVPTYIQIGEGNLRAVRKLGLGRDD